MTTNEQHIQRIVDELTFVAGSSGFGDYMPAAKVRLYARQSTPSSYEDGVFRSGQFYHWVRQEHSVPDHVFSRVFAKLKERLAGDGVEVELPEGFNPSFDEVIKEYLRYDHDERAAHRPLGEEFADGDHAFERAVERDLAGRIGGEESFGPEVKTPWDDDEDIPHAIVISGEARAELVEHMKDEMRQDVERELYTELGPVVHDEVREQVELELRAELRSELLDRMRGEVEAELQKKLEPALREELYPVVHEKMANEIRLAERLRIERDLGSELRERVWEQVRAEIYDAVREEVKAELWKELQPVVEEQLAREYEEDELAAVMGTGDTREPHEVNLTEEGQQEEQGIRDPHAVEFDQDDEAVVEEDKAMEQREEKVPCAASETREAPAPAGPILRAEDQLKLIKIIREKLAPAIRTQIINDFEVIARAQAEKAGREQREARLADPEYCGSRLQGWLFPDQPHLWERVRPLLKLGEWASVVRLLEDDATELDRDRLERSRPVMRETLKLKADIEEERKDIPEDDSERSRRRLAGVRKMLAGSDEIINFTLKSLSAILETDDPRPRARET